MDHREDLKAIPSVDSVLRHLEASGLGRDHPRPIVVRTVRAVLERERLAVLAGERRPGESAEDIRCAVLRSVEVEIGRAALRSLIPVVNATGIIVHTNLGRAPLSAAAVEGIAQVAAGYSNLEYDLVSGRRGSRDLLVLDALRELSGAEDALVVNNNAAAVLLALDTLARGREVIVSRSELIEIGDSFRLPDVFGRSGVRMVPVGTTNRTRLADYESAIRSTTGAIMTAHWSNYSIVGFVERAELRELVALGARYGIPVIHDLGSGILAEPDELGLTGEMTLRESIGAGASVVSVSGDKLLGGPQAGIVVGRADAVSRMRANPLRRALRPGKLTLAALQATLTDYLSGDASAGIPVLSMIRQSVEALDARAHALAAAIRERWGDRAAVSVVDLVAKVGGGAAPDREIPSRGVQISVSGISAGALATRMLAASPPVVARTRESRVLVDLRTVFPREDAAVLAAVGQAVEQTW